MANESSDTLSLFEFILNSPFFEEQNYFFKKIDGYLKTNYEVSSMEICSIHSKFKRKVWSIENKFKNIKRLDELNLNDLKNKDFIIKDNLICLLLGDYEDSIEVLLIESKKLSEKSEFLGPLSKYLKNSLASIKKIEKIKKEVALVDIDDVTGLYNSRRLHKDLQEGIQRYEETGEKFSVLFIDIDHFKNVNDGHGHLIGTGLLAGLAEELKKILREYDNLYRYGGDEFVILLPKADSANAKDIGERILEAVKKKTFVPNKGEKEFKLSLSIGIATFPDHATSADDLLAIADKMMYHAKELGRGRVCLVNELF